MATSIYGVAKAGFETRPYGAASKIPLIPTFSR